MRFSLRFTMWLWGLVALALVTMALYGEMRRDGGQPSQAEEPVAVSSNTLSVCEVFGERQHKANEPTQFEDLTLYPASVHVEALPPDGTGSRIHSVVSGSGVLKRKNSLPRHIQFTCLMNQSSQPVYFHTNEANGSDPVQVCSANVATIGEAVPCLKETLAKEEATLAPLESEAVSNAAKVDQQWQGVLAGGQMALSNTAWRQYRDQECLRREKFRAGGNHPDITRYACLIEKTRQRIQDFQEP